MKHSCLAILLLMMTSGLSHGIVKPEVDPQIYSLQQNYGFNMAVVLIDSCLADHPCNADLWSLRAKSNFSLYQFDKALADANKALSLDSTRTEMYFLIGSIEKQFGRISRAIKCYLEIIRRDYENQKARLELANLYFQEELYPKALEQYFYVANTDTTNLFCIRQIARCYDRLSIYTYAVQHYSYVLSYNPTDKIAVFRLSNILMKDENYSAGIEYTSNYLSEIPDDFKIMRLNAYLYLRSEQPDSSIARFERLKSAGDSSYYTYKYLGLSYFEKHDYELAHENLEAAYQLDTANVDAELCYFLGISCGKSYYKAKGIKYLKRALKLLEPDVIFQSSVYEAMGNVYTSYAKYDEALDAYFQALSLTPENHELLSIIANHFDHRLKQPANAKKYYTMYLDSTQIDCSSRKVYYERKRIQNRLERISEEEFWYLDDTISAN